MIKNYLSIKYIRLLTIFFGVVLSFIFASNALAGSATLNWNANTEPDLAGYKVYYDTLSHSGNCPAGFGSNFVDVGNVTSHVFNNLTANQTYYFSVAAYDTSGNLSPCASEVSKVIDSSITLGETNVLSLQESANSNNLYANLHVLSQTGTVQSMSFYAVNAAGKVRLGIYDSTGPSGGPGALKAATGEVTVVAGWNTANVTTPISLDPGNYWLAMLISSDALITKHEGTGQAKLYTYSYGALPTTYSTTPQSVTGHGSEYATLTVGTGDTTAPVTTASPAGNTFTFAQSVTLSANEAATIYYTTNGTTPTTSSAVYLTPMNISASTTLKFFAKDAAGNSEAVKTQVYNINIPVTYNISNVLTLVTNWLQVGTVSDVNADNIVNVRDLGIMMSKWQ